MRKMLITICLVVATMLVVPATSKGDDYIIAIYTPERTESGSAVEDIHANASATVVGYGAEYGRTFDVGSLNLLLGFGAQCVDCQINGRIWGSGYYGSYEASVHMLDLYGKLGIETSIDNLYVTGKFGGLFYPTKSRGELEINAQEHYGVGLLYKIPGDKRGIIISADNDNLLNWSFGLGAYWKF